MRLIDADRMKEKMATTLEVLKHIFTPGEQEVHLISAFATVGEMADDCPTIDAVEVVRCRDCKHFAGEGMYCSNDIIVQFDHFYCYHGERKDDVFRRTD